MSYRDTDLDSLDGYAASQMAELELDLRPADLKRRLAPRRPVQAAAAAPARRREPEPPEEPTGPSRRALELAEHDSPPSILVEGPYAIAVIRRNRALRQKLPALRRLRDAAELDLEAATLELGRAVHAGREHERAAELGTALRIADARSRLAGGAEAERTRLRDEARATIAGLEESIVLCEASARPLRTRARELQAEIVVFQQDFEAVSRVIHEATTELAAMERSKGGDVNRRIELEAMCTNRRVEVDAALAEIEARTPELRAAEAQIAELDGAADKARAEIEATSASLAQMEESVAKESGDVLEAYERALVELADEAVRLRLDHVIAPSAARLARLRHDTFAAHSHEVDDHELALTLHYPGAVRRGLVGLVLLTSALLAAVGWLVVP